MKALQIERPPNGALTHRLKSQKWNKVAVFLSCLVFGVITQALLQSAEAQIKYTVTRLVPISGVERNIVKCCVWGIGASVDCNS
jgi:hypothetical protein